MAHEAGVVPNVLLKNNEVLRRLLLGATEEQLDLMAASEETYMKGVDAYIGVRGAPNVSELSDVPQSQQKMYERYIWKRVHMDIRVSDTRWVVLRWPTPSMAQQAEMSHEEMMDFFFEATLRDWEKEAEWYREVNEVFQAANTVRIVGKDTDLSFSTEGRIYEVADGHLNMPDGEIFTAPVDDSAEGQIYFEFPGVYFGERVPEYVGLIGRSERAPAG